MRLALRRWWVVAIGIIIVVALLAAGGILLLANRVNDEDDGTGGDAASLSRTPTPSPSATTPFDPADRRETAWGTELIRLKQAAATRGRQIQIYFVVGGSPATLLSQARKCADAYLLRFRSASCYAFDSEEALIYTEVAETGGMEHLCWRAFVSASRDAEGAEGIEEGQYKEEGCPEVFPE